MTTTTKQLDIEKLRWADILASAVRVPGSVGNAYRRFWRYSLGNQLLAMMQCAARGIEIGPISTFAGWQRVGRNVKRGEKAIAMLMPVTCKTVRKNEKGEDEERAFSRFVAKRNWFVLSQTDGEAVKEELPPDWDDARALAALDIERVQFRHTNGNVHGYASGRKVAVSPVATFPLKTLIHEMAHVMLGHTALPGSAIPADEGIPTTRSLEEVEAESVALLVCDAMGKGESASHSRAYIQHWLDSETIQEGNARRIFSVAQKILVAGRPEEKKEER